MVERLSISDVTFTPAEAPRTASLLGYVSCVVNDQIYLDGMTLHRLSIGKLAISFPSRTDVRGRKHPYFRPTKTLGWRVLERAILRALPRELPS